MIYIIQCPCNKTYVGETSRSLKERITEHRRAINRKECNHKILSVFFLGIEKVKQNSRGGNIDCIRKKQEAIWIFFI